MTNIISSFKNKKIMLIEPPFYRLFGYKRYHYPITLVLIGTYLEKNGNTVKVYDFDKPTHECKEYTRVETRNNYHKYEEALTQSDHPIWADIKKQLAEFKPDIIGITAITAKIDSANIIAKLARTMFGKDVTIILGGPHANGMLKSNPTYDFEGYYDHIVTQIPELVNQTPNKTLLVDYEKYTPKDMSSVLTSSGCPNRCTFCCHSFDNLYVYRSETSILEELNDIKNKYGSQGIIYVMDDCLFSNPIHFKRVCALMKKTGLKFVAGARIMALSQEKLAIFKESGGQKLYLGVESGSQKILDKMKKNLKVEEIKKRTKWVNDLNIPWSAFLMAGLPYETIEDIQATKQLITEIKPTFASLNQFTPYPGTEIYDEYYVNKNIPFKDLFQLNGEANTGLNPEIQKQINHFFDWIDEYNQKNSS